MAEEKRTLELTDFEHRLLIGALADYRNILIRNQRSTRDVNDIILKLVEAPRKRSIFRCDREAR